MNVLFLTTEQEDYLQDQILSGLRTLSDVTCTDIPRKEQLYTDCGTPSSELYGNGFTVWKRLDPVKLDRSTSRERVLNGEFSIVIFGSIHRQKSLFEEYLNAGAFDTDTRFVFLDGEDFIPTPSPSFDYARFRWGRVKRRISNMTSKNTTLDVMLQPKKPIFDSALAYGDYYKRELTEEAFQHYQAPNLREISFSIPGELVRRQRPKKRQLFQTHVQCSEAYNVPKVRENSTRKPIFDTEEEYYSDLSQARYGITMKKAGWDCMRHYEIAANYSVPAVYDLYDKPSRCAPHNLRDMYNCVSFSDARELQRKIEYIKEKGIYWDIADNAQRWALRHTCKKQAQYVLGSSTS